VNPVPGTQHCIKMENSYFDRIPDEIMIHIFRFLPSSDLCSVADMSPRFMRLVHTRSLWINVDIDLSKVCKAMNHLHKGTKILSINITQYWWNLGTLKIPADMLKDLLLKCPKVTRDGIHKIVSSVLERFRYMCPLLFSCVFPS
jgi:hypothetical protein